MHSSNPMLHLWLIPVSQIHYAVAHAAPTWNVLYNFSKFSFSMKPFVRSYPEYRNTPFFEYPTAPYLYQCTYKNLLYFFTYVSPFCKKEASWGQGPRINHLWISSDQYIRCSIFVEWIEIFKLPFIFKYILSHRLRGTRIFKNWSKVTWIKSSRAGILKQV